MGSARFSHALLEVARPGVLDEDLVGVDTALANKGIAVDTFLRKDLSRGRVPVTRQTFLAGRLDSVGHALRQLGVALPEPNDYPEAAGSWLGRRVWASTLGAARARVEDRGEVLFIKPRGRVKRFTGRVFSSAEDFRGLPVTSAQTHVWCAEVVEMLSEHRAFVVDGQVLEIKHYSGDGRRGVSLEVVDGVVGALAAHLPAGCALDFAVLADGRTVLVEVNDGYALGRYGLDPELYALLLLKRWAQLLR